MLLAGRFSDGREGLGDRLLRLLARLFTPAGEVLIPEPGGADRPPSRHRLQPGLRFRQYLERSNGVDAHRQNPLQFVATGALQHPEKRAQERRSRDVQADGADAPIQPGIRLAEAQIAHTIEGPADDRMGSA